MLPNVNMQRFKNAKTANVKMQRIVFKFIKCGNKIVNTHIKKNIMSNYILLSRFNFGNYFNFFQNKLEIYFNSEQSEVFFECYLSLKKTSFSEENCEKKHLQKWFSKEQFKRKFSSHQLLQQKVSSTG